MSRARKIIIFVAILDILAVCCVAAIYWDNHNNQLELKTKKLEVEFGERISLDASDYLKQSVDKQIIKNTKVTYKSKPVTGQKYDKVGRYIVKLTYKDEVAKVKVTVRDTKKPKFNKINEFQLIEGVEIVWGDYIKATDLSSVELNIDSSSVNINAAGEYTLKASAIDENGNEREKEIRVVVSKKPANMSGYSIELDEQSGIVTVIAVRSDGTTINIPRRTQGNNSGNSGGTNSSPSQNGAENQQGSTSPTVPGAPTEPTEPDVPTEPTDPKPPEEVVPETPTETFIIEESM